MRALATKPAPKTHFHVSSIVPLKKLTPYVIRAQKGDIVARDIVIVSSLPLVITIAFRHLGQGIEFDDLVQEGNLGVFRAIERMDFSRAANFGTLVVFYIHAVMYRAVEHKSRVVRIPNNTGTLRRKIQKYILEGLTIDEIARKVKRSIRAVTEVLENPGWLSQHTTSEELPMGKVKTTEEDSILNKLIEQERTERLYKALSKLPKQDQWLLKSYYGLGGLEQTSQVILAEELHCTHQTISVRVLKALEQLRGMEELDDVRPG